MKEQLENNLGRNYSCPPGYREMIIRWTGIILLSLIFPIVSFDYPICSNDFIWLSLLSIVRTAILWNGSMFIINYLVTKYSVFKQPARLIIYLVSSLMIFVAMTELAEVSILDIYFNQMISVREKAEFILFGVVTTFMISAIYASVSFFMEWKANLIKNQALEKANLEARYETLRNQINPHFLFNSLNTLLMMVADNPEASRYVESISDLMRYMLNSRDKDVVLLKDELKIARDYSFIQKSRFGEKLLVSFKIDPSYYHYVIPPLTLQMLIENAIKHNVVSKENPLWINVSITENQFITVENNIQPKLESEPSTGVGLENIRNRYLFVAGKEVIINNQGNTFKVLLPLFEKQL